MPDVGVWMIISNVGFEWMINEEIKHWMAVKDQIDVQGIENILQQEVE